ncbi:MAG TPA: ubiquinol-cytochrome C chaperone family protein [Vitreimonas sp.]|uniref:ubiquinol-cytochrome C chaperone family protein n=1 Tax=Vitreimonas sp. TaxID=3069702 RepID=UPI002D705B00|nr:ubiquinol-cytochrome C chaperone family protein [Vitreimonas sp.]HYD85927.1 ubiquinol-cytochrome C chaperone family protein [Vitreimonas sp.]
MPIWPFRRSRAETDAEQLLEIVTAVSRNPAFFGPGRAPDTLEGRFEMMTLIASLALMRLQREGELAPLAQAFTDQLFRQFDAGLRETGVSDTAVPKRMHKLAGDFYGRLGAYAAAVEAGDGAALGEAIARNTLVAEAGPLTDFVLNAAAAQAERPASALLQPDGWPSPPR